MTMEEMIVDRNDGQTLKTLGIEVFACESDMLPPMVGKRVKPFDFALHPESSLILL